MRTRFVPLGAAFCCVALCQEKPDAAELVRTVRSTYANARRFHFVASDETTEITQNGKVVLRGPEELGFAGDLPNKGRFEGTLSGGSPCLVIVNGEKYFVYLKDSNTYVERKGGPPETQVGDLDDLNEEQLPAYLMLYARAVIDGIQLPDPKEQATVIGEQRLGLDKGEIDCWVVETRGVPGLVRTWWVDKRRYIVRRADVLTVTSSSKSTETWLFNVATIDEPLSPALFRFAPPNGAKRVSKFSDLGSK